LGVEIDNRESLVFNGDAIRPYFNHTQVNEFALSCLLYPQACTGAVTYDQIIPDDNSNGSAFGSNTILQQKAEEDLEFIHLVKLAGTNKYFTPILPR